MHAPVQNEEESRHLDAVGFCSFEVFGSDGDNHGLACRLEKNVDHLKDKVAIVGELEYATDQSI